MGEKLDRLQVSLAKVVVGPSVQNRGGKLVKISGYEYLGHDASGNEIKVGSPVKILAGPDKGNTAEVTGQAKGGGLSVRIGSGLQKRTAVVDPDEVRVMVRSFQPKGPFDDSKGWEAKRRKAIAKGKTPKSPFS